MPDPRDNNKNQPLGQSIGEIVDRTTAIVHEEIELAKAEIAISLQNLLRGSVAGIVGGVFAFFGLFILLIGLSFLIGDAIGAFYPWLGFLIVALLLFVFGGVLAMVALKNIKKGSQLVPEQAIAEAQQTKAALSEEPAQTIESSAVEEPATGEAPAAFTTTPPAKPAPQDPAAADPVVAEAKEDLKDAREEAEELEVDAKEAKRRAKKEAAEAKEAEKAARKAEQEAAKADAIAAKAAAKAEKEAEKARAKADKEAEKAAKQAEKELKKAGKKGDQPAEQHSAPAPAADGEKQQYVAPIPATPPPPAHPDAPPPAPSQPTPPPSAAPPKPQNPTPPPPPQGDTDPKDEN